jgi:hypothetical protein
LLILREQRSDGSSNLQSAGIIIKLRLLLHRSRLKSDNRHNRPAGCCAAVGFGTRSESKRVSVYLLKTQQLGSTRRNSLTVPSEQLGCCGVAVMLHILL